MGEMKHLVVAKFKEGAALDDVIKGMEKLVSEVDFVSSFEWGQDIQSPEMLRQGFTHAFLMTFKNQEDFSGFLAHPKHAEFSATFSTVIENVILLDFPAVVVKPSPPPQLMHYGYGEFNGAFLLNFLNFSILAHQIYSLIILKPIDKKW
ncbi:hypothetical protein V2J09_019247 [Rumex salicifolius]